MPDQQKKTRTPKKEKKIAVNKKKILKALLDHSELTREEIAKKTRLIKKYGQWAPIKDPLDELIDEKLVDACTTGECEERRLKRERENAKQDELDKMEKITKEQKTSRGSKNRPSDPNAKSKFTLPKKRGVKPPVWIIKRDMPTVHTIFNRYQDFQELLWNLEWVRDLVVEHQFDTRALNDQERKELKKMLGLSRHFFELGVNYSELYLLTLEWKYYLDPQIGKSSIESAYAFNDKTDLNLLSIASYRNLFAFCYFMDEFEGDVTPGGYKIIDRYSRHRLCGMIEAHQDEILSGIENVIIPTLKGIFGNISDESFDLLNLKNPDGMKTIRSSLQDYTAWSNLIKRTKKTPDSKEKIDQYRNARHDIFMEILDTLKNMRIIKKIT